MHAKQAKYLTSNTRLQGVLHGFKSIEKIQISRFNVEYQKDKGQIEKNVQILDNIKHDYPEYVYKKLYLKYCQGLNYIHEKASTKSW